MILGIILVILISLPLLMYIFADFSKTLQKFYCFIGWHSHSYEIVSLDGSSVHAKCKWCGYEGMVDSQGNLF